MIADDILKNILNKILKENYRFSIEKNSIVIQRYTVYNDILISIYFASKDNIAHFSLNNDLLIVKKT